MIEGGTQDRFSLDNGRRVALDVTNRGQLRLAMQLDIAFEGLTMAAFVIDDRGFTVVSHPEMVDPFMAPDGEFFPLTMSTTTDIALAALKWLQGLDTEVWLRLGGCRFRETDLPVDQGWWRLTLLEEALPAVVVQIGPA